MQSSQLPRDYDPMAAEFKALIDNFELEGFASPAAANMRVKQLLGSTNLKKLYGLKPGQEIPQSNPTEAREKFLDHLVKVYKRNSGFSYSDFNEKYREEFGKEPPQPPFSPENDPRALYPELYAPELKEFLKLKDYDVNGNPVIIDGEKLFKAAMEEEAKSTNYLDAVFLCSLMTIPGQKWKHRFSLIIGGASGAGKSFLSKHVIKRLVDAGVLGVDPKDNTAAGKGNLVIAIDGGYERSVSQMRQMVLQANLEMGYPGIGDLDDYTHFKIKNRVQEAVMEVPDINMVLAETFADTRKFFKSEYWPRRFEKKTKGKLVYAYIRPGEEPGATENMQQVVQKGLVDRSFNTDFRDRPPNPLKMNNRKIRVESKAPKDHFTAGNLSSGAYDFIYNKRSNTRLSMPIIFNRRLYAVVNNDIVEYDKTKHTKTISMSENDLQQWRNYKEDNKYQSPNMPPGLTSPYEWYEEYCKKGHASLPEIKLIDHGKEIPALPENPQKNITHEKKPLKLGLFATASQAGSPLEVKEQAATPPYAQVTEKGKSHLEEASIKPDKDTKTNIGTLGRIFDTAQENEIPTAMKAWVNDLFTQYGLGADISSNPHFTPENIEQLKITHAASSYLLSSGEKQCELLDTDVEPKKDYDLYFTCPKEATFIRYMNPKTKELKLYYFAKSNNKLIEIPLTEKKRAAFTSNKDFPLAIGEPGLLLDETGVNKIHEIIGRVVHQPQDHTCDSIFDENRQLSRWIKKIFPPNMEPFYVNIIRAISEKALEITFDAKGDIQKWLIDAIETPFIMPAVREKKERTVQANIQKMINEHGKFNVYVKILFAVNAALREALLNCNPHPRNSREWQALRDFLLSVDILLKHMDKYYLQLKENLTTELNKRHTNPHSERALAQMIKTAENIERNLLYDPLMPINEFIESTKGLIIDTQQERMKQITDKLIVHESVTSNPNGNQDPQAGNSPSLFHSLNKKAEFSGLQSNLRAANQPQIINIELHQKNGESITAALDETASISKDQPISDMNYLDEKLDPAKFLALAAYEFKDLRESRERLGTFLNLDEAEDFFEKGIKYLKKNYNEITKDGLFEILEDKFKDDLKDDQIVMLSNNLFKTYKNTMEQMEPYPADAVEKNTYDQRHFPCDALIRLAKIHRDSFKILSGQEKPEMYIGEDCFDPHYIEAAMLVASLDDSPIPSYAHKGRGWDVPALSFERKEAFKKFYAEKFSTLDQALEAEAPKPIQRAPSSSPWSSI